MALLPILKSRGPHFDEFIIRLTKLKANMSMTRKVLRFGKEIPLITGMRDRIRSHEVTPQRMILFKSLSDFFLILYFFTDHPLFFNNIGLYKYTTNFVQRCDYINNVFWLVSSLFDIMCTVVEINHVQKKIKKVAN